MNEPRKFANPFPGLRPFETDEYLLFFGREGQSDELLERLARTRFLAVVGTSGSGKSSLIRAGLLPAIRGGLMAGAGSGWRIAVMRPGHDPVGNLACVLAEKDVLPEAGGGLDGAEAEAIIEATLRRGSLGLVDAARQARLSSHGNLLVVVDQFEELFRFRAARSGTSTGDDAAAFVKLLLEAARQRELPIYVVLTMRSDFLGDCAQFQGLPEAINDGQYLIPRMTRDERRVAITGPVAVARGRLAEPLVNRLLNEVGDNPDQLPILQHALMRTWDFWKQNRLDGEPIGVGHYEAIGTMSDALSRHADEAFNELDERQQKIAEQMFKALTEKGADNREIRRPARLSEIAAIVAATPEEVVAVIEVFRREGRSFLMPPVGVRLDLDTVIDISHESLIRNWARLRRWVNEEAESAHMYRRLAYAAEAGGYISGAFLETALDWREQQRPNATWADRYRADGRLTTAFEQAESFLDASADHRDALIEEEERRRKEESERERRELEHAQAFAKQQQRVKRRLIWLAATLCLILLFALGTVVYAFRAKAKAVKTQEAGTAYRDALSFLKIGDVEEARRQFKLAAAKFSELRDINGEAASYMDLGDTYFNKSLGEMDPAEGTKYYDKADELSQKNDDLNGKAPVLRAMGNTFINAARTVLDENSADETARITALNLLTKGQRSLERARKAYQDKGDREAELIVLNQLGDSVSDERFWPGDPAKPHTEAIKYYEEALDIYRQQKVSAELKGMTLSKYKEATLKLAHIAQGKHEDASADIYREMAVNASGELGGEQAKANTLLEISLSFGPGEQQKTYEERAVNFFKEKRGPVGEAEILIQIGNRRLMPYLETRPRGTVVNLRAGPGENFKVIDTLKAKTRVFILADDGKWFKGRVDNREGFIKRTVAQEIREDTSLQSTLDAYQRALEIYKSQNMPDKQGELLRKMADVDLGAKSGGDRKRALDFLNTALGIYKGLEDIQSQKELLRQIVTVLLENGDAQKKGGKWQPALASYSQAADLVQENDSLLKQVNPAAADIFAGAFIRAAEAQEALKQPDKALVSYQRARQFLQEHNVAVPEGLDQKINSLKNRP